MSDFPAPLANANDYPVAHTGAIANKHLYQPWSKNTSQDSQFNDLNSFTKNGRSAITIVAQALGIKAGETILLPEYFCPAMVEPFIWLGIKVEFYRLNADLTVDQQHFKSLVEHRVTACLFVRFFGFSLDIESSLLMAKNLNLLVIEDCAHSFFSPQTKVEQYEFDASICSLNKFFPCSDGGMYRLIPSFSEKISLYPSMAKQIDRISEVKEFLSFVKIDKLVSFIKKNIGLKRAQDKTEKRVADLPNEKTTFRYFNEKDVGVRCFKLTQWLVTTSNFSLIKQKRRKNYHFLYRALRNSPYGKPLFELENKSVPYVFPFLLNNSDDFHYIRSQGIQILRWEEYYATENMAIELLRERLIQIPCHQSLTEDNLDEIISIINKVEYLNG